MLLEFDTDRAGGFETTSAEVTPKASGVSLWHLRVVNWSNKDEVIARIKEAVSMYRWKFYLSTSVACFDRRRNILDRRRINGKIGLIKEIVAEAEGEYEEETCSQDY